jgi:hypothetical protein
MSRRQAYVRQEPQRRHIPIMSTASTLNKMLPNGSRPTIPQADDRLSAQSLRPTFDGWGPRL